MSNNLHKNHRQRLRKRFLDSGIQGLSDHEILELLLFYAIPRVDTNELAHRMIDHFGSLAAVFEASEEEMCKVFGIGQSSAVLIKLVRQMYTGKILEPNKRVSFKDYNKCGQFLAECFRFDKTERFMVVLLDAKDKLINTCTLAEGDFDGVNVNMMRLLQLVVLKQAAKIIVAHNHFEQDLCESVNDTLLTDAIDDLLSPLGVELKEHYIVSDKNFLGLKQGKNFR